MRVTFVVTLWIFAIVLVGMVALYLLGLVSGGLGGVEGFIASLGFTGFRFTILPFLLVFVVVRHPRVGGAGAGRRRCRRCSTTTCSRSSVGSSFGAATDDAAPDVAGTAGSMWPPAGL